MVAINQRPRKVFQLRKDHPAGAFTSIYDTGSHSIELLKQIFLHMLTGCFLHDLVVKRYRIRTEDGTRLNGREPCAHDIESVRCQLGASFRFLELSRSHYIMLCGRFVREKFVKRYGEF